MKILKLFTLLWIISLTLSCNDEETPPAFFVFEDFEFVNNPSGPINQGSLRHKIPAAFVTLRPVEGESFSDDLGIQNIPSTFPFLGSGEKKITITPNVPINGSSTLVDDHPHIAPLVFDNFQVEELQTYNLDLTFQYKNDNEIIFLLNEDFEGANHTFLDFATDDMLGTFVNSTENVYEGNSSGQIVLNEDMQETVALSLNSFELDPQKNPFIELDINTSITLSFGIQPDVGDIRQIGGSFNTEGEWKKFYYPIRDFVTTAENQGAQTYQFYFAAFIGDGDPAPSIFVDNIKVMQAR